MTDAANTPTPPDLDALRARLLAARRLRQARRGDLGPVIATLHRFADALERDDVRTSALRARAGGSRGRLGVPPSFGCDLIHRAAIGGFEAWRAEWLRLLRTESLDAARAWSAGLYETEHRVAGLVYPDGAVSGPVTAAEVRALAGELAASAAAGGGA
ncbi:hypothetical protein RM780_04175 [Streptomyces sp. DSM 44917]|uniref:Uncharacterized protein n=1 Tax=Streptomyces boetiae TaxID=3075541 RepID=A0ABU2L3M0_9ACTN|nr:hypothetical protein [Streptomyces sp. DSM 44917]MDT0306159.1 hypothetical protein [Streptomyces sp. DSM 44917]